MQSGQTHNEQADFLLYCFQHAHSCTPLFTGETLKNLFQLASRPVPDWLEDEDRVYEFFSADDVIELAKAAAKLLKGPHLRLVK